MSATIDYYNSHAEAFFHDTVDADMSYCMDKFLSYVGDGEKCILDAGCGSGRDSLQFINRGYMVDAFDASREMCRIASEYTGIDVKHMTFENLNETSKYDGIWACASLLHVSGDQLQNVLERLSKGLKSSGKLYASFKKGKGERMKDGRFFHDMTEEEARILFEETGMHILEIFVTGDVRKEKAGQQWVNIIAERI